MGFNGKTHPASVLMDLNSRDIELGELEREHEV